MAEAMTLTFRKIYQEDIATGVGTDNVNVMGVGVVPLHKIPGFGVTTALPPTSQTPAGAINASNVTFTLSGTVNFLSLFLNGLLLNPATDYTLVSTTVTMTTAPQFGDVLYALVW